MTAAVMRRLSRSDPARIAVYLALIALALLFIAPFLWMVSTSLKTGPTSISVPPIWVPDPVGSEKPAQNRMKEAAAIPGLEVYVVSCPKDLTMFEDALKTTGNEGKFVVKELIELIREAVPARRAEAVPA